MKYRWVRHKYAYYFILMPSLLFALLCCFNSCSSNQPSNSSHPEEEVGVEIFGNLYDADPMDMFPNKLDGLSKKKIQIDHEIRNALLLTLPSRIETRADIIAGHSLQFGFGVYDTINSGKGDGIQLVVSLKNSDKSENLYTGRIKPKVNPKAYRWSDVTLDMSRYAGQEVTLAFEVSGSIKTISSPGKKIDTGKTGNVFAAISDPRIIISKPTSEPTAQNIVLISIDTLRADHLGCRGYKRKGISPNIDRLAEEGILFENAFSPSPWTVPSHVSLFTSLLPSYHRVNEPFGDVSKLRISGMLLRDAIPVTGYRTLAPKVVTFTEILKSKGYVTAAFTGGGCVHGYLGLCKGFDSYRHWPDPFLHATGIQRVTKWLEDNQQKKFFLFLHTYRCHSPYLSYKYANEVMSDAEVEKVKNAKFVEDEQWKELKKLGLYRKEVTEALYDGEIFEIDEHIGILVDNLKRLGLYSKTIIIFTSDHGEEFYEHKMKLYNGHGHSLYDEVIKIPLIFRIPGFSSGVRFEQLARLIDVAPTVLDLVGVLSKQIPMQGISLLPLLKGEKMDQNVPVIAEATDVVPEMKCIRTNKWKYIYSVNIKKFEERILIADHPDKEELYDLESDPGEQHNIQTQKLDLSERMKTRINTTLKKALSMKSEDKRITIDSETKKKLKTLGYIK